MSNQAILDDVEKIYREQLTDQPHQIPEQIKAVKALIELYIATFKYHDYDRTRQMVAKDYIQHNPTVGTGVESIIEFAERDTKIPILNFKLVLVDGQYIMVHLHVDIQDNTEGLHVMEVLRYENGLFTEHWDVMVPVLPLSERKNSNGVF